ncbi:MAG: DMT family transporter [Clostridia bacterium]
MANERSRVIGHVLSIITILIWGSTFICTKLLFEVVTPIQILVLRFGIGYVACCVVQPKWTKPNRDEWCFLLLGVAGCSLYSLLENTALTMTSASNVSIIVTTAPILTAILAHFLTKDEKLRRSIIVGSLIAFLGAVLVIYNGSFVLKLNPIGDLLSVLAALCWAIYSVALKKVVNKYGDIFITRKVMFYGFVTSIPMMIIEGAPFSFSVFTMPKMLFCILFLGLLGSCLCYIFWHNAIKRLGLITTSNYIYVIPFITVVVAAIVLGEKIELIGILGAVLIICGVIVSAKNPKPAVKPLDEAAEQEVK